MRLVALTCLGACAGAQTPQQGKQSALGAALAAQVRRSNRPLSLADVSSYITNLGFRLAAQMPDGPTNWTFTVIRDSERRLANEPIALPGGYIFVSAPLILAANNESELAGMLAHSMAHVIEQQTRVSTANAPTVFISTGSLVTPRFYAEINRRLELEADRCAVAAMSAAGFDPGALLTYLSRIQPSSQDRISNVKDAMRTAAPTAAPSSGGAYRALQDEVRRETMTPTPSLRRPNK